MAGKVLNFPNSWEVNTEIRKGMWGGLLVYLRFFPVFTLFENGDINFVAKVLIVL